MDIKSAVGHVKYDVEVRCPLCGWELSLNSWPYNDEETDYNDADDYIGLALFGTEKTPAKWENINIEIKCFRCKKHFQITSLEI